MTRIYRVKNKIPLAFVTLLRRHHRKTILSEHKQGRSIVFKAYYYKLSLTNEKVWGADVFVNNQFYDNSYQILERDFERLLLETRMQENELEVQQNG